MTSLSGRHRDGFALGGWLFADLLLALAVLFVAAIPAGQPRPTAEPSVEGPSVSGMPTPRPSPSPSPTPAATECIDAASLEKDTIRIAPPAGASKVSDGQIVDAFASVSGSRVGLLLTFTHGRTPGDGTAGSRDINSLLRTRFKSEITATTITEAYFTDSGRVGTVIFEIYLLSSNCS